MPANPGLEGDDAFVRVVRDDQEDLARHLVDVQLLGERTSVADPEQRQCRVARFVLELLAADGHDEGQARRP
jgi:hypothetical protein